MRFSQNYRKQIFFCSLYFIVFSSLSPLYAQITFNNNIKLNALEHSRDSSTAQAVYPYNKKRIRLVGAANLVGYGGALIGLNAEWYAKYPRSGFHFFNDDAEWLQVDKVGHAYSAYSESRGSMELWRWAGLSRKQRIWLGGLSGVAYQSIIEVLDGFSSEYGFSPGDFAANILGSGIFMAQEFAWDDQRIKFKFSFHKRNYVSAELNQRADVIYGKTEIERFIKDYNAQTYWLSANLYSFFPQTKLPRWLSFSVGYGAEGMFGATSNIGYDKYGNVNFDRNDIKRYRQWYLSPDVDFTKIRTNKKGLKILFFVLSAIKFPAPALEYSKGSFKGHWIVF
jgi:Predicted periplasmic lipoprotein (DUF2279)